MILDLVSKYSFIAGILCLDFANTVGWHASEQPAEGLTSYADLLRWAYASGSLGEGTARALFERCEYQPAEAAQSLVNAIQLRESIYRIFSAYASGSSASSSDLAIFNRHLQDAHSHSFLSMNGYQHQWVWNESQDNFERPVWPVVHSAMNLLISQDLRRVGQCQDEKGCGWLFLDTSRNRSRRWCSMGDCGNRAKAHRHYERSKKDEQHLDSSC